MPDTVNSGQAAVPSNLTLDTASQAKSLDELAGLASVMEAPAGAPPGTPPAGGALAAGAPPPNPLAIQNATVIAEAVCALRDGFVLFTGAMSPKAIATDSTIAQLAAGWGSQAAKRGYDLKALVGDNFELIPLCMSTIALAYAVVQATKAELMARKAMKEDKSPAPEAAPASPPPEGSNVSVFPGSPKP